VENLLSKRCFEHFCPMAAAVKSRAKNTAVSGDKKMVAIKTVVAL
jgi:hypothetical protein